MTVFFYSGIFATYKFDGIFVKSRFYYKVQSSKTKLSMLKLMLQKRKNKYKDRIRNNFLVDWLIDCLLAYTFRRCRVVCRTKTIFSVLNARKTLLNLRLSKGTYPRYGLLCFNCSMEQVRYLI